MYDNDFICHQKGYLCFDEKGTKLLNDLDLKFKQLIEHKTYTEIKVPSIISGNILETCGYFETFPQHLSVVGSLKKTEGKLLARSQITNLDITHHDYYLTPAACVHIYPMLIHMDCQNQCYTMLESVYRYEDGNFNDRERLWEFTVREFVFVGTREYVLHSLNELKEKALQLAQQYLGEVKIEAAHDNFYPSKSNKIRTKLQIANHLKDELVVSFENRNIAIASFNYHNLHFSKPFHFDKAETIVSGCVGFGMERWVLSCLERGIEVI